MRFSLQAPYKPAGGQPEAISKLADGFGRYPLQTLLGITGSGKTFIMANLIAKAGLPTLVLAHNKTLAAQLYQELRELFPHNRVEYFVSYYDYYQPESYLPATDTYIEKDSSVNEQIEKMRLKTTSALLSRKDVIVVASISCIYGLGNPADFAGMSLELARGALQNREELMRRLVDMQYTRSDILSAGMFRARGDVIEVIPACEDDVIRIELEGNTICRLEERDHITGQRKANLDSVRVFPARQFVVPEEKHKAAMAAIREELASRLPQLAELERERLQRRVTYDLEMIEELGYCTGIENYSRHFDGRKPGEPPFVLLDYFPKEFMLIVDESHQTIPQAHGMYNGDRSRKQNLVDFGFRLPCAYDNRPLTFEEFERRFSHVLFVSATPGPYELRRSGQVVELIVRPTGLLDPRVEVRPTEGQMAHLVDEIAQAVARGERALVTTLTKKGAEDLADYFSSQGVRVRYMHSDIDTLDRIELVRQLRAGEFDVLVGINLLREGLDIPEVSLVAILDADKEGFLRNETSLIQTIGRASRNVNGKVVMYADSVTESMRIAIGKTNRRRAQQEEFNAQQGIVPRTIVKPVAAKTRDVSGVRHLPKAELHARMVDMEAQMRKAAEQLDFERAIELRDALRQIEEQLRAYAADAKRSASGKTAGASRKTEAGAGKRREG